MPRWLRISLRIFMGGLSLLLLLWAGLAWYIKAHKQELLQKLTVELGSQVGGKLTIRDMEPSLWKSFPNISIALKEVSLQDSQWSVHRHSLLQVRDLFVRVNTFRLFSHKTEIQKITAAHGSITLYTDSTGYSNSYLLSRKDTVRKARPALLDAFGLEDVAFHFINERKNKNFNVQIRKLDGRTQLRNEVWEMKIAIDAQVHQLAFNINRGGFLRNQELKGKLLLHYNPIQKTLDLPEQEIKIGGEPIQLTAGFFFNQQPAAFRLRIRTKSIPYAKALSWVSPNIGSKLKSFQFVRPIALDVHVSGIMQYKSIPLVNLNWEVKDNELQTPVGSVTGASFKGNFNNEAIPGNGHGDDNSRILVAGLDGAWMNIPFHADTIAVTNLLVPYVDAHIRASTPLSAINDIIGGNTFLFQGGKADADIHYLGGILQEDPTPYTINGQVRVMDAGLTYIPRNLSFNRVSATVLFRNDDLLLRDVVLHSKSSSVRMEGEALHFLRLYFSDPGKVNIQWRAQSPLINLDDFLSFVGRRKAAPAKAHASPSVSRIGNQLNQVLEQSSIGLDARVDRLIFKNFQATGVVARASLAQSGIILEQVQLAKAGGKVILSGVVRQEEKNNPFHMKAKIINVDVADLFKSFDDFGQQAISYRNLGGRLTADAEVSGLMSEGGRMIKNSMNGTVDFRLADGVLNQFSPFEKIGRFAFKKRNLSHVTFKDIHNKLEIHGDKITIHPMTIESSAINMNVQGIYSMTKGTDIYVEIPLRNPEKEEASTPIGQLLRKGKGFVIHLRAQDGDESGVKIGWDPLRHGRKSTDSLLSIP